MRNAMRLSSLTLLWVLAGCSQNPTPRCALDGDCQRGEVCYRGLCLGETAVDGGTPPPCALGTVRCGTVCANLLRDVDHCGRCEHACGGRDLCTLGECTH